MEVVTVDGEWSGFLKRKCRPVTVQDNIKTVIEEMKEILLGAYDGHGKGLAAPQVGLGLRFFILRFGNSVQVFINPEVTKRGNVMTETNEGCLSIPGKWFQVARPRKIEVRYLDENLCVRRCKFHDFDAVAFQHELDHLDGILISDRGLELVA